MTATVRLSSWKSRFAVIAILLLAGILIGILQLYLKQVERTIAARIEQVRIDLASAEARPLIEKGNSGIRKFLEERGHLAFFSARAIRSRNLALLARAYDDETAPEGSPVRRAWLILLLASEAPQAKPFFELISPGVKDPELKSEVEKYLKAHEKR